GIHRGYIVALRFVPFPLVEKIGRFVLPSKFVQQVVEVWSPVIRLVQPQCRWQSIAGDGSQCGIVHSRQHFSLKGLVFVKDRKLPFLPLPRGNLVPESSRFDRQLLVAPLNGDRQGFRSRLIVYDQEWVEEQVG